MGMAVHVSEAEPKRFVKNDGHRNERQISMDRVSVRRQSSLKITTKSESFNMILPPAMSPPRDSVVSLPLPLLSPPVFTKWKSSSVPNSAASSPRFNSMLSKMAKSKIGSPKTPPGVASPALERCKSFGDGRARQPSLDIDQVLHKLTHQFSVEYETNRSFASTSKKNLAKSEKKSEKKFKCNALCLYIPSIGKGKPLRSSRKEEITTTIKSTKTVLSRTVSLEKFECGSWASTAMMHEDHNGEQTEVRKNAEDEDDSNSPVSAAFVFDRDLKGVLKKGSSFTGKSNSESPRHVRFSTSVPVVYPCTSPSEAASCITPRLRKARDDFNAFLEAQAV